MANYIKSIPTRYKEILFRSRLEAKWASFFDLMNWRWQYEPRDFNGWIPDFAIYGHEETIYVEVKPTVRFMDDVASEINASGCTEEVLLIGETCPIPDGNYRFGDNVQLGWLRTKFLAGENTYSFSWNHCHFACYDGNRIGFAEPELMWFCRIYGTGGKYYRFNSVIEKTVSKHWACACNSLQWKRPQ